MSLVPTDPIQFAALVAHQIKGPVATVSTLLQTLLGELAGPITPKQRQLLEKAIARCDQSLQTAQRLMTISQALRDPSGFQGTVDLVKITAGACLRYSDIAEKQNIKLTSEFQENNCLANGNESAISEAIEALINNAIKYTPDNGKIHISVKKSDKDCTFCISDSGIGIAAEHISKLFKPFFRTTEAKKTSAPGTGLGLSFVKAVVQAAGGNVKAAKSEFGGAEFTIMLPVSKKDILNIQNTGDKQMKAIKVVIVGGVAAGPKVAAKIMRLMPDAMVTIVEKGKLMSYAGCGLPYYISGQVQNQNELMSSPVGVLRDSVFFQKVKNITILNQTEALEIDTANKKIKTIDLIRQNQDWLEYDKLVLATGSLPILPKCAGIELTNIFTLHGVSDAEGIKSAVETAQAKDVVIVGGGLIGIEMTEALTKKGCRVTIVEKQDQILPMFDWEFAKYMQNHLHTQGVKVLTDTEVFGFEGNSKVEMVSTSKFKIPADIVIISTGTKPNIELAQNANIQIGQTGAIKVNQYLQTSNPDIFAVGDCTETISMLTNQPVYLPLGSTANKQGRIAAVNICGKSERFPGTIGTVGFKIFDFSMAKTGLTQEESLKYGYDIEVALAPGTDREHFAPEAKMLLLKLIVDKKTRKVIGAQAAGTGEAAKRIDIASMAILGQITIDALANADLCYSPPFSPVLDNIITAANVVRNKLDGIIEGISPIKLYDMINSQEDFLLLDVRNQSEYEHSKIGNSICIPLASLRARIKELPKDKTIITMCNVSVRGYEAALILKHSGYKKVKMLDGGLDMYPYEKISG